MIPAEKQPKAEPGTIARRDQVIAEIEYLKMEVDSVFAAVNPKAFNGHRNRLKVLQEELDTYYND